LLPIGLLALPLGVWHLRARSIGGYQTVKDGGGGRYYPEIALSHGEGRPLGILFLVLGTLWPAAVACVLLGG
jgi:hypothetical protein